MTDDCISIHHRLRQQRARCLKRPRGSLALTPKRRVKWRSILCLIEPPKRMTHDVVIEQLLQLYCSCRERIVVGCSIYLRIFFLFVFSSSVQSEKFKGRRQFGARATLAIKVRGTYLSLRTGALIVVGQTKIGNVLQNRLFRWVFRENGLIEIYRDTFCTIRAQCDKYFRILKRRTIFRPMKIPSWVNNNDLLSFKVR